MSGMRSQIRAARKFSIFVFYVVGYLVVGFGVRTLVRDGKKRRRLLTRMVHYFAKYGCILMGIQRKYCDPPPREKNFLFVGNHLGFLDILILSSHRPTVFVTSVEMQNSPFLGLLCEMGGCLFVERRNRRRLPQEISLIREVLREGANIAIYPEGTSSDGSRVLPFKKSLLASAAESGAAIKIMVLNYRKINGEPISHKWRDYVCWYGDLGFVSSLWRLFSLKSINAELSFHDEIEFGPDHDRRVIAEHAQRIVEQHFAAIPLPQPEDEKV